MEGEPKPQQEPLFEYTGQVIIIPVKDAQGNVLGIQVIPNINAEFEQIKDNDDRLPWHLEI